jgi:hypothetical protein
LKVSGPLVPLNSAIEAGSWLVHSQTYFGLLDASSKL